MAGAGHSLRYGKLFLIGDWPLEGEWFRVGLVYFNRGWSCGSTTYELHSKPRSLALYRRELRSSRFLAALP